MMDEYATSPLLINIIELFEQRSTPRPVLFHCLGIERPPDIFCFCQNCATIGPYIVLLNDWILRNLTSDKASEPEAWSHRPMTKGNPAALMTLLSRSGQNLNSRLKF